MPRVNMGPPGLRADNQMPQHAYASAASSSLHGISSAVVRPRPPRAEKAKGRTAEDKEAIRERNLQ
eukprot:3715579-Prorocentrum_lima.AAC.1